ncbi:Domain of unknown function (DUF3883), putative [Angomonas deanei]|uniref:Protein NO VEIN C-terminal domain-containing protein n=1 Tax=Angomonas deanei TaxID=59799 RepID=A0A7G2CKS3_9TRYP|nr:Domain of unknown function (DUF3883), putative [Angomonas deanei]
MVYAEVNTNFTNHVKAVVFRDVFLPLTPSAEVQRQLTDVLQTIFSVFSTIGDNVFANGPSPDDERFLRHSLDKALRPYNVRPYAITNETQLPAFTVSTSKSSKFRNHCPNGLGALHYPKWAVGAGKHHRAGGGGLDPATLQNHLPQWVEDLTVQPVTPSAEERVSEHKGTPDDDRADENEGFIVIHPSSRKRHREEGKVGFSSYPTEAERYVYHSLQSEMADDKSVSVLWVNEEKEAGTPYDIVVYRQDKSGTREVLFYVEVKSTTSSSKKNFEMSIGELIMSARYGKQYKIYRVFNAELLSMKGNGKVKIYEDVIGLWRQSKLTLSGEIRVMPTF